MVSSRRSSTCSVSSSSTQTPDEQTFTTIFVKTLRNETISLTLPTSTTLPALLHLISLRTSLPPSSVRLSYSSKVLTSPSATLASLQLPENATLALTSPLRGGAPKRPRCGMKDCKEKAQPIVGDCGFCSGKFCAKHRMLEDHACPNLEDCKKESKERNTYKLESERTHANQGLGF